MRKLRIQKVPTSGDLTRLETILELNRNQSTRLIEMLRAIDAIPIEGESSVHVDDQLLRDVFADPTAMASVYADDPERFRELTESDADASDVIALQHRRMVASAMRNWLEDDAAFAQAKAAAGGPERAWQELLEANPWVLGIGLGGQLLTSWKEGKLDATDVAGPSATHGARGRRGPSYAGTANTKTPTPPCTPPGPLLRPPHRSIPHPRPPGGHHRQRLGLATVLATGMFPVWWTRY